MNEEYKIQEIAEKIKDMLKEYTIKEQDEIISLLIKKMEEE